MKWLSRGKNRKRAESRTLLSRECVFGARNAGACCHMEKRRAGIEDKEGVFRPPRKRLKEKPFAKSASEDPLPGRSDHKARALRRKGCAGASQSEAAPSAASPDTLASSEASVERMPMRAANSADSSLASIWFMRGSTAFSSPKAENFNA